jgi:hypothetical protein
MRMSRPGSVHDKRLFGDFQILVRLDDNGVIRIRIRNDSVIVRIRDYDDILVGAACRQYKWSNNCDPNETHSTPPLTICIVQTSAADKRSKTYCPLCLGEAEHAASADGGVGRQRDDGDAMRARPISNRAA